MIPTFRYPTESDIVYLAEHLRRSDINDLRVVGWDNIEAAVRYSIKSSDPGYCFVVLIDDLPLCVFGCCSDSLLSNSGIPWLLGTDEMMKYRKSVTAKTRLVLKHFLERWDYLSNCADARNRSTLRWLKTVGFKIGKPFILKHTGYKVTPFEMERP